MVTIESLFPPLIELAKRTLRRSRLHLKIERATHRFPAPSYTVPTAEFVITMTVENRGDTQTYIHPHPALEVILHPDAKWKEKANVKYFKTIVLEGHSASQATYAFTTEEPLSELELAFILTVKHEKGVLTLKSISKAFPKLAP